MAVNVTANWRLIRSFDPLLRLSQSGRALFMTSGAAHRCRPFWGPYSVSKAALNALVQTYAKEVEKTAIRVVAIDPGRARTAMRAQAMPGEDPATLPHPSEIVPHLVEMASAEFAKTNVVFEYPAAAYSAFPGPG
jgi:NAD(P)-dependent dehydrogenase (short-subunit alcohol dehydrogenase family)